MTQGRVTEDRRAGGPSTERGKLTRLESILVVRNLVGVTALREARERQAGAKRPWIEILLEQNAIDEELAIQAIAHEAGMSPLGSADLLPDPSVQSLVPADVAQRLGILPLRIESGHLLVATADPFQLPAFDDISARAQLPVRARLARPSAVRAMMRLVRPDEEILSDVLRHVDGEASEIVFAPGKDDTAAPVADIASDVTSSDSPVVRFLNLVLTDAIRQRASDVHIECEKDALRVRIRVDGELREIQRVSSGVRTSVLSRLKIVAGLDIMETRRPQDGRAHIVVAGREYDLRVSTLPSYFGEKAVIRVLDPGAPVFDLSKSGIEPLELNAWRELLRRPNGLILMTGPTGSGKTSTLYASLLEVRDPSLNVVTVEDPVEFQFPGIVHVPVRADIGFTFAAALRSILRQDPDVILLGEIRDAETAEVAVQAALTGHLVLSTLHTNDAPGAVARMMNLGVPAHLLSSCLLGVMAQRLVRTVCEHCAEPAAWNDATMEQLGFSTAPAEAPSLRRGKGCARCRASGFKGRAAIAELLRVTRPVRFVTAETGGSARPRFFTEREVGFFARIEAMIDQVPLEGDAYPERFVRTAIDRLVARTMLAGLLVQLLVIGGLCVLDKRQRVS